MLTTGQHRAGADIGLGGAAWRDWDSFIHLTTWAGGHVAVAPPGIPLFYALLSALFDAVPSVSQPLASPLIAFQCSNYNFIYDTPGEWAAAWFGVLMPIWTALAVFPLYAVARRIGLMKPYTRLIVLVYALVPSLSLFAPTWSTLYPFISLCIVWLLIVGLERRSLWRLALVGLLLGTALFMNYTFLPLGAFVGIYATLFIMLAKLSPPIPLPHGEGGAGCSEGLAISPTSISVESTDHCISMYRYWRDHPLAGVLGGQRDCPLATDRRKF